MVSSEVWGAEIAERYDADERDMFDPDVLGATVRFLAESADGGDALEFAVGTGRVAIPLAAQGIRVCGIELSEPMAAQLLAKAPELPVTIGDMARTRVPGQFGLVYLVFNTLGNLLTQDEQVDCFVNAARHLSPGGRFVIEIGVPPLRHLPPGATAVPFDVTQRHTGFDTFELASQHLTSHHYYRDDDGAIRYGAGTFRFVWPSELDLMARIAGLEFEARYADWDRGPFTDDSPKHVSVWRKPV